MARRRHRMTRPVHQKRRQLSRSAATQEAAIELERRLRAQVAYGRSGEITLESLVEEWWKTGPRLAATTRANYRSNLERHVVPILGDRKVQETRPRLVAGFLGHLRDERELLTAGVDPRTVMGRAGNSAEAINRLREKRPLADAAAAEMRRPDAEEQD